METPALAPEYHRARLLVVVTSASVFLWRFAGGLTGSLPLLNIEIPNEETLPYGLAGVLLYAIIRVTIEWAQSSRERRALAASRVDLAVTMAIGLAAVCVLAPSIVTFAIPSVSLVSAIFLVLVGVATGTLFGISLFGLRLIRSREEARRLALPRIPVAVRVSWSMWIFLGPVIAAVIALSPSFSEPMSELWLWFAGIPVCLMAFVDACALFSFRIKRNFGSLALSKRHADSFRWVFDRHDAAYQVGGWDSPVTPHNSRLYEASECGDIEAVRQLIDEAADPNEHNMHGWTPLLIAVAQQHADTVRLLLDAGADPNLTNLLGRGPLMFAARYGNEDIAKLLIEHGSDTNRNESNDPGPLAAAAAEGHCHIVELLLSDGADARAMDDRGMTALDWAERRGHGKIASILRTLIRESDTVPGVEADSPAGDSKE